jgi:hypothetical protein
MLVMSGTNFGLMLAYKFMGLNLDLYEQDEGGRRHKMEKRFKPQPNCKCRVDGGVLDPNSVRSRAGDTSAVSSCLLPSASCLLDNE